MRLAIYILITVLAVNVAGCTSGRDYRQSDGATMLTAALAIPTEQVQVPPSASAGAERNGAIMLTKDRLYIMSPDGRQNFRAEVDLPLQDVQSYALFELPLGYKQLQLFTSSYKLGILIHPDADFSNRKQIVLRDLDLISNALRMSGVKELVSRSLIGVKVDAPLFIPRK